jgi:hypothetical protein
MSDEIENRGRSPSGLSRKHKLILFVMLTIIAMVIVIFVGMNVQHVVDPNAGRPAQSQYS